MSFLPDARRRDEINFIFLKSVPYNIRFALVVGALVAGIFLQFLLRNNLGLIIGLAFLGFAMAASLVHGYSNIKGRPRKRKFERCSREEFEKVLKINSRSKQWDKSFIDVTCVRGAFTLIAFIVFVFVISKFLRRENWYYGKVFLCDTLLFFVPQWLTGVRRILKNAPLITKVENFIRLAAYFESQKEEGEQLEYWLEVGRNKKGELPTDAKLMLKFQKAPPSFLGMQVQMAINNVQGKDYPYMYCVLIAERDFQLHKKVPKITWLTTRKKREKDGIDIYVIRQTTTRTSGYHTRYSDMKRIFTASLSAARMVAQREIVQAS